MPLSSRAIPYFLLKQKQSCKHFLSAAGNHIYHFVSKWHWRDTVRGRAITSCFYLLILPARQWGASSHISRACSPLATSQSWPSPVIPYHLPCRHIELPGLTLPWPASTFPILFPHTHHKPQPTWSPKGCFLLASPGYGVWPHCLHTETDASCLPSDWTAIAQAALSFPLYSWL